MNPPEEVPTELANHPSYADVRFLGRGGMGVVYLARNRFLDRPEVLKVLNSSYAKDERVRQRFLREVQIAAKLHHPHVAMVFSAFPLSDRLVMAMEYVPGENLAELVRRAGLLTVQKACAFACQVAVGLQHAHDRGLVHRDIKPGNIIATERDRKKLVKIIDFGLAKAGPGQLTGHGLTQSGAGLGTPTFMAPEQARNAAGVDGRADLYSLGATLYFLLAGRPPIVGDNEYDQVIRLATEEPVAIRTLRPDVPPDVADAVAKLLQKNPAARFQDAAEVAAVLLPFARKKIVSDDSTLPTYPQSSPAFSTFPPSEETKKPDLDLRTEELHRDWYQYTEVLDTTGTSSSFFEQYGPQRAAAWKRLAEDGEPMAMLLYGRCLEDGRGMGKNEAAAVAWYRQAAERGQSYAMFSLALCLENGRGVAKDEMEAMAWYRHAAELEHAKAMINLGVCRLRLGTGGVKNEKEAVAWYRRAAELGNADGMIYLGVCLAVGKGGVKDEAAAVAWYRQAAELGQPFAMFYLAVCLEAGRGVAMDEKAAVAWYRRAAELGQASAMTGLGMCLQDGIGVAEDVAAANVWYRKAAELGDDLGLRCLIGNLKFGYGFARPDLAEATRWQAKLDALAKEQAPAPSSWRLPSSH
ncbi:serine/threonine-protein kinase [Limnoglobus roseus]|nr:serine/threonine-protein kinase [Limnoglobus roseus]